ncbi:Uncharacterized protein ALO80_00772 [Pseudomonas caricapapayae]|uniref:HTH cro/C1-type domain-containing protein n=1 Tax=Pseudomonas caricapapayae TaxID=46678 RepID=A0A0P9JUS3_9PSED|nr:helix-turn-helix domain-containing protein [Pseudomonas caricapapayae]KPW54937.1 Uncharacterized protein ALO80_00772 [Pseudomonas caricapapayae]RMM12169.1 hypothetical protein ALQ84_02676 [Pseudomonas caricapapayae]RMV97188.1 hypothetical protein ALP01_200485 [Pseudomonas caricapapayae]
MLGSEFRAWRKELNLTQEAAGARFGVSRFTVQKWERDQLGIPSYVEYLWMKIKRETKQRLEDFPVQLVYVTGEPWLRDGEPHAQIVLEDFPNNTAMLRQVHQYLNAGNTLHLASVIEKGKPEILIWTRDELLKEIEQPLSSQ